MVFGKINIAGESLTRKSSDPQRIIEISQIRDYQLSVGAEPLHFPYSLSEVFVAEKELKYIGGKS